MGSLTTLDADAESLAILAVGLLYVHACVSGSVVGTSPSRLVVGSEAGETTRSGIRTSSNTAEAAASGVSLSNGRCRQHRLLRGRRWGRRRVASASPSRTVTVGGWGRLPEAEADDVSVLGTRTTSNTHKLHLAILVVGLLAAGGP